LRRPHRSRVLGGTAADYNVSLGRVASVWDRSGCVVAADCDMDSNTNYVCRWPNGALSKMPQWARVPEGRCQLCQQDGPLQVSHILPKALYRYVRTSGGGNTIEVTKDRIQRSSKQATAHLLCSACEQRFNENGERWMLRQGYRGQGRFRLRETLVRAAPFGRMDDGLAYSAVVIPEIDVRKITYYASSIFWRASVCSSNGEENQPKLGERYECQFREYLLGNADFPLSAVLVVQVAKAESPLQAFCFPFSQRHAGGYHQHTFLAQGVLFWLFVGGRLLPRRLCIVRSPEQFIFLSDKVDPLAQSAAIDLMAAAMSNGRTRC